jgi:hypothetical protein
MSGHMGDAEFGFYRDSNAMKTRRARNIGMDTVTHSSIVQMQIKWDVHSVKTVFVEQEAVDWETSMKIDHTYTYTRQAAHSICYLCLSDAVNSEYCTYKAVDY